MKQKNQKLSLWKRQTETGRKIERWWQNMLEGLQRGSWKRGETDTQRDKETGQGRQTQREEGKKKKGTPSREMRERERQTDRKESSYRCKAGSVSKSATPASASFSVVTLNSSSDGGREVEACDVCGVTRHRSTASLTHVPMSRRWRLMLFSTAFRLNSLCWKTDTKQFSTTVQWH